MTRNKKDVSKNMYLIGIIMLICIILLTLLFPNKKEVQENSAEQNVIQETEEKSNINIIENLKQMNERERIEFYSGMFFDYIETAEYEKAYELLHTDFKKNYFSNFQSFKEYAQKTFPEMANIEYDNIERNGDVYVLWIYISDAINGKPGDKKEMNIVIQENDYNDFVMSFSVI